MKFSGHETFSIREGWLHKGLKLTIETPEEWLGARVEDALGVGRNMGKSIRHWLDVTGLVTFPRGEEPTPTDLGKAVWAKDPYFADLGTWWVLHIQLVNAPDQVTIWHWFFNTYARSRFTKADALVALRRHVELNALKRTPPSTRTLERDLACLLSSYARPFPPEPTDPEDARECPFQEIELLRHYPESGTYQVQARRRQVPPQLFAYSFAVGGVREDSADAEFLEIPLHHAAGIAGGPGRAFCLSAEQLFDEALRAEKALAGDFQIGGLAGDRILRVRNLPPLDWLSRFYDEREARDAA